MRGEGTAGGGEEVVVVGVVGLVGVVGVLTVGQFARLSSRNFIEKLKWGGLTSQNLHVRGVKVPRREVVNRCNRFEGGRPLQKHSAASVSANDQAWEDQVISVNSKTRDQEVSPHERAARQVHTKEPSSQGLVRNIVTTTRHGASGAL